MFIVRWASGGLSPTRKSLAAAWIRAQNYTQPYGTHDDHTRFVSSFSSSSLTRSVILAAISGSSDTVLSVSIGVKMVSLANTVWQTPGAVSAVVSVPSDSGAQVNCSRCFKLLVSTQKARAPYLHFYLCVC